MPTIESPGLPKLHLSRTQQELVDYMSNMLSLRYTLDYILEQMLVAMSFRAEGWLPNSLASDMGCGLWSMLRDMTTEQLHDSIIAFRRLHPTT
jgi:hypothetical protein